MMRRPHVKLTTTEEASLARWRRWMLALYVVVAAAMTATTLLQHTASKSPALPEVAQAPAAKR
jgi:Sec-independent protein secretion pathway component TatC